MILGKVLMFIKPLRATACLAFLTLCGVSITSLIGFDADQPSGWGEVLTLISILAAGFIAACTLFYANHQAKKERERIAYARAKTLFRECEINHIPAIKTLYHYLHERKTSPSFSDLFKKTFRLVQGIDGTLRKDIIKFGEADSLYIHHSNLGDAATNVIIAMQRFDYMIKNFFKDYAEIEKNQTQNTMDADAQTEFEQKVNALMSNSAVFLGDLEEFRRCQTNIVYRQPKTDEALESLAQIAISQAGAPTKPIKTYDPIELFSALHKHFKS